MTTDKVRIANLTCEDVVSLGRAPYTNWIGRMQDGDRTVVERSLDLVGMSAFARKTLDRMSDGECQRVMIARALAQDTPVILLDEPTAFLDLPNRYELATLLRRLSRDEGKCILFSTHDLDIALSLCDAVALIDPPDAPQPSGRGDGPQRLSRTPVFGRKVPVSIRRPGAYGFVKGLQTSGFRGASRKNPHFFTYFCTRRFFVYLCTAKAPHVGPRDSGRGPFVYRLDARFSFLKEQFDSAMGYQGVEMIPEEILLREESEDPTS